MKDRVLLSWSSGKDSALSLYELKKTENIEVAALLTTVTEGYDRISMHGVRRTLLAEQAIALGYPLEEIAIHRIAVSIFTSSECARCGKYAQEGIQCAAFGDLFPGGDTGVSRRAQPGVGMRCLFPLWEKSICYASSAIHRSGLPGYCSLRYAGAGSNSGT
jgi:diphthamide synthase (EF-2-diphthine--ammonia ligase)